LQDTDYPACRRVMGPERLRLDDSALESLLMQRFPGTRPEDVENFMNSLQSFGRQAAPLAQRALPGVVQGASTGAVAGPWGAVIGGLAGGAASLLSSPSAPSPAAPPAPAPAPTFGAPAPAPAFVAPTPTPALGLAPAPGEPLPSPAVPGPAGTGAPAATAQLLSLLSRPETMQALLALLMSNSGRGTVPVGAQDVPAAAFAGAIAEAAALVADAAGHPLEQAASAYLFDGFGRPRADVVNPSERAALLISDLAALGARQALDEQDAEDTWDEDELDEPQDDPLDGYEDALRADGWR